VALVADTSLWRFFFITENNAGLAVSAKEEPLLIHMHFIKERKELGLSWSAASVSCCVQINFGQRKLQPGCLVVLCQLGLE